MIKLERKYSIYIGLSVAILSFMFIFIGVRGFLGNEININNIFAFMVFSIVVGIIAFVLVYFTCKIAFICLIIGLILGYFEMYRAFLSPMTGWGDLIGIVSLFMWASVGLGLGLVIQLGVYLYKKFKRT